MNGIKLVGPMTPSLLILRLLHSLQLGIKKCLGTMEKLLEKKLVTEKKTFY
jgi:hypothetical protein